MANNRIMQQEMDDYTKVMGAYNGDIDAYNVEAEAFNKLPVLAGGGRTAYRVNGQIVDRAYGGAVSGQDRVIVSTETYEVLGKGNQPTGRMAARTVATKAPVPVAPTDPGKVMPTFSNKQIDNYNDPQPTLAQQAMLQGKSVNQKYAGSDDWKSGISTDKGILQRVLLGEFKK